MAMNNSRSSGEDTIEKNGTAKPSIRSKAIMENILSSSKRKIGVTVSVSKATAKHEADVTILDGYYRMNPGIYKIVKRNIEKVIPFLLLGPTGVGKTEMIDCMARTMGLPLTIFDMGTMTDPIMSLVGTHIIKVQGGVTQSKFATSRFSQVIQKPGIVLLDEISRSSPQANNLLFPVLDFRRELSMEYSFDDTKPIPVHPQCVFVGTANLGSQYVGTHKLDKALVDRFMLIEIDPLSNGELTALINHGYPKLKPEQVSRIVNVYSKINDTHDKFDIPFNLSVRHIKLICSLVIDSFTIYDAFYTICKGIGSKEGLKALTDILAQAKV